MAVKLSMIMDDKKRVLVESGAEKAGSELEMKKVSAAIRMLGSSFFTEFTSGKREKNQKTYDHLAFGVDEVEEYSEDHAWEGDDTLEEDNLEILAAEDEDASMILQFENALMDTVQEDKELATFYVSYQEARKRLLEKSRSRGFWPSRSLKGGKKGKGKGVKGKSKGLAHRIANSTCRICGQTGHWKAECPSRKSTGASDAAQIPTSFVVELDACLKDIPEEIPDAQFEECFTVVEPSFVRFRNRLRDKLQKQFGLRKMPDSPDRETKVSSPAGSLAPVPEWSAQEAITCFASTGSIGVVDLGASQTVIGSKQVPELLESIPETIRKQIKKTSCNLVFRFGNHQTLTSRVALILPVHRTWFRVAIVPGPTPFLLSSSFLRTIQAVIDAEDNTLWSKKLGKFLETTKSSSNLMLLDINQLWPQDAFAVQDTVQVQGSNPIQSIQTAELVSKSQPAATASPIDAEQCVTGRATELSNLIKPNPNEIVKVEETTEVTFSEERICPKQSTWMFQQSLLALKPIRFSRFSPRHIMSLSQKLALFQEEIKREQTQEDLKDIDQLPMSTLKTMTIKFGKAKLGQSFEEAFQDQGWTKWLVATYENSKKTEHRTFLRYVSLRVEEGPNMPMNIKKKSDQYLRLSAQEPGKPSQAAPVETSMWDPEEHQFEEILEHQQQQDLRMSRIENALMAIMHHIESKTEPIPETPNPWTMVKEEPK